MSVHQGNNPIPSSDFQFIGVDIGGTKCAVSHWDGSKAVETSRFSTKAFPETYSKIEYAVREIRDQRPLRIGVSCGGPLDSERGLIGNPPNLPPSWHKLSICQLLRNSFGGEATLMNDANACALAEWQFGAGRETRHMIFITSGTGFGAGLILNGNLFVGATGDAGEIGHVRLAANGPEGYGKVGSVEGFCSGGGIARLAKMRLDEHPEISDPWKAAADTLSTRQLADAAYRGDPFALMIFEEVADRLGESLALLVDLFNPELIVLGGFFPKAQGLLEARMNVRLAQEALPRAAAACKICSSQLGDSIGNYGAIAAARYVYH